MNKKKGLLGVAAAAAALLGLTSGVQSIGNIDIQAATARATAIARQADVGVRPAQALLTPAAYSAADGYLLAQHQSHSSHSSHSSHASHHSHYSAAV